MKKLMNRNVYCIYLLGSTLLILLATPAILLSGSVKQDTQLLDQIPETTDWVDYGTILTAGEQGDWNHFLYGGFAATAIKKDGIYYLYYQGASGYRTIDDSVTGRTIGVATSTDGINFIEYEGNPILTWSPGGGGEEGAVSSSAVLFEDKIYMFYGANTEQDETRVNADARWAISTDGIHFSDQGVVLSYLDNAVWGSGDELFPIIAFEDTNQWFVYYLPNGVIQSRLLGVAWGESPNQLTHSARASEGLLPVSAWGTGGYAKLSSGIYALFLNNVNEGRTDVRTVTISDPSQLSEPITSYQFEDYRQATFLLDQETQTWFMYYRNGDQTRYGVKLAPSGTPDLSPPTAPVNVKAVITGNQLVISWEPAFDPETGVVQYHLYWDNQLLTSVKGLSYQSNMVSGGSVEIFVTAVNYHGVEGPPSESIVINLDHPAMFLPLSFKNLVGFE